MQRKATHHGPLVSRSTSRRAVLRSAAAAGAGIAGLGLLGRLPRADAHTGIHEFPSDRLRMAMRKLWEDHVTWTRLFLVSAVAGLPDLDPTTQRLLQNQADIGEAIQPYYGDAAAGRLTALLREHITTAAEVVGAAKAGDAETMAGAKSRWYANAEAIAAFLSGANPKHWPLDDMNIMMREHLDRTLVEAGARLVGDWAGDIAAYDEVHTQILLMADMLTAGIVGQFPERFL